MNIYLTLKGTQEMQEDKLAKLSRLVGEHKAELSRYAVRLLRDAELAKDAVQEAFVAYLRNAQSSDAHLANPRAWLFKATRNRCLDILKSAKKRRELNFAEPPSENIGHEKGPDEIAERKDMLEIVRKKLNFFRIGSAK